MNDTMISHELTAMREAVIANQGDDTALLILIDCETDHDATDRRIEFLRELVGARWEKQGDPMEGSWVALGDQPDRYIVLRSGVREFAVVFRPGYGKLWECRVTFGSTSDKWQYPLRCEANKYGAVATARAAKLAAWRCLILEGGR